MKTNEIQWKLDRQQTVKYELKDALVLSVRGKLIPVNHWRTVRAKTVVALDPVLGAVCFTSSSDKVSDIEWKDSISGEVSLTGYAVDENKVGDPFVNGIKWAKIPRKGEINIQKRFDQKFDQKRFDLSENV